ncbi:MAG: L,D-transpeptidase family protein [Anaerolineales bacterium]|nr:L,D-transpeptidase family protein [Anaerolineales bacterium]
MTVTRRDFLKFTGLAAAGLALPHTGFLPPPPPEEAPRQPEMLGRAVRGQYIYARPSFKSDTLNFLAGDTVFNIYGSVISEDNMKNKVWFRVRRGFVHSASVQLVGWRLNTPSRDLPPGGTGFLGEVTVPFTQSRVGPGPGFRGDYRFYYGTTHWIRQTAVDNDGRIWYGIFGDRTKRYVWVPGEHIRRVTPEELAPISPEVSDKYIEVSLSTQTLKAYENGQLVLETLCSTGIPLREENGRKVWGTPIGEWQVISKRPSRHMAGDDGAAADFFDLPGVPWVTYFHWWGTAVHGTYWHTDFGRPRSHGCVNLPHDLAKWIYRWTTPVVPPDKHFVDAKGTRLVVVE